MKIFRTDTAVKDVNDDFWYYGKLLSMDIIGRRYTFKFSKYTTKREGGVKVLKETVVDTVFTSLHRGVFKEYDHVNCNAVFTYRPLPIGARVAPKYSPKSY